MSKEWLISRPKEDALPLGLDDEQSIIHIADYEADDLSVRSVWGILGGDSDPSPADSYLIGAWSADTGMLLSALHPDYFVLRPLGNVPSRPILDYQGMPVDSTRGGDATGELRYAHWATQGSRMRRIDAEGSLYPADNAPFRIDVRHKYFTHPGGQDGWGWRAEIMGVDGGPGGGYGNRKPNQYRIGVYEDPDCTILAYSAGAFRRDSSEWQFDENNEPIQSWFTETIPGKYEASKMDWHLAVLRGSSQHGYNTLRMNDAMVRYLFWEDTQKRGSK